MNKLLGNNQNKSNLHKKKICHAPQVKENVEELVKA